MVVILMSTRMTQWMIRMNARYLCAVACICFLIVVLRFIMDVSSNEPADIPATEWNTMTWTNTPPVTPWAGITTWTNRANPFISPQHRRLILQYRLTRAIERLAEPEEPDPAAVESETTATVEPSAPPPDPAAEPRTVRIIYRGALRLIGPPSIILSAPDLGVEQVLQTGDAFEGLRLKSIGSDRVVFTHAGTEYEVVEGKETVITIP